MAMSPRSTRGRSTVARQSHFRPFLAKNVPMVGVPLRRLTFCAPPPTKGGAMICIFVGCNGHDDKQDAILHGLKHLAAEIAEVKRIQRDIQTKEGTIMTSQEDVDAAVASIGTAVADLGAQNTAIQTAQANIDTEIEALAAQVAAGGTVDTSALVAAGQALATATGALDGTVAALQADPNVPTAPVEPTDPGSGDAPTEV